MVVLLGLLSGALMSAAFAPVALWFLAPLSFLPLFIALESRGLTWRLASIAGFGLTFFGSLLHWTGTYVGVSPWILLTILQASFYLPLAFITPLSTWRIFLFPSVWLLIEEIRSRFPFGGFGWGRVAFSQADSPLSAIASVGGAPFLTFATVCIGLFVYLFVRHKSKQGLYVGIFLFSLSFFGLVVPAPHSSGTLTIAAVQGGVPELGLQFNARARVVLTNHLKATENYLKTSPTSQGSIPELILWPENAVDIDPYADVQVTQELNRLTNAFDIPLILGAVTNGKTGLHNESILWKPGVGSDSRYVKTHLTPFGEYMPLRTIAEFVSGFAKEITDFKPGHTLVIHHVKSARISPLICFELIDDDWGTRIARAGNIITVQTNSATFGLSAQSAQQLGIARIRAIEHQRSIATVSTSGLSAFVDFRGAVYEKTKQNVQAVISKDLTLYNQVSFSDRYRRIITPFLIFSPFFVAGFILRRGMKK